MLILYVPVIVKALVVLFIGLWIIKWIRKFFDRYAQKGEMDESLRKFLSRLISLGLKLVLIISVISMMGVATASFIAILGAAGLAIGLSLQGSLANLAGGVLILLFKPFKVGDVIETQGYIGSVSAIEIFNTILITPDNKKIILPNGAVSNGPITNFSAEEMRRVDFVFGIGYDDDINKAKSVLQDMVSKDERILKEPASQIVVSELGDSSVNITVRVWCKKADYWGIYFDMQEAVKKRFDQEKISIPFPQRDVHLYNEAKA
jgi:small conductance mechanosensitive channel